MVTCDDRSLFTVHVIYGWTQLYSCRVYSSRVLVGALSLSTIANGNARYENDESTAVRRLGGSPTADVPRGLLRKTMTVLRK